MAVPRPLARPVAAAVVVLAVAVAGCAPRVGSLGPAPTAPPAAGTAASQPAPAAPPGSVPPASVPPGSAAPSPGATDTVGVTGPPSPTGTSPRGTGTLTIELWYARNGRLEPTRRVRPATPATSRLTLAELAAGPTPTEAAAGLRTTVGRDVTVEGIVRGVETLTVGASFDAGDATTVRLRRAQVVYSLTQFPTVTRVVFHRAGRPDSPALSRADLADLLAPIVVTAPGFGETVPNPVTVTGTADVFEATVNVRILDAAGRQIAAGFTLASCGSGCRGDYRLTLGYRLSAASSSDDGAGLGDSTRSGAAEAGRIEVFEVSARDGSRVNLVSRPVRLTPSG